MSKKAPSQHWSLKAIVALSTLLFALLLIYWGSFWVLPSVTVVNNTDKLMLSAQVTLPSSKLSYDVIPANSRATLHYFKNQADGLYQYRFELPQDEILQGECGYVISTFFTDYAITLEANGTVSCQ